MTDEQRREAYMARMEKSQKPRTKAYRKRQLEKAMKERATAYREWRGGLGWQVQRKTKATFSRKLRQRRRQIANASRRANR